MDDLKGSLFQSLGTTIEKVLLPLRREWGREKRKEEVETVSGRS